MPYMDDCLYDEIGAADPTNPVRLWLLRLLMRLNLQRGFIGARHLENEAMATFLGLGHWIDRPEGEYDPTKVRAELRSLHAEAERGARQVVFSETLLGNIARLARLVNLSEIDQNILIFIAYLKSEQRLEEATDCLGLLSSSKVLHVLAVLLDLPERDVRQALALNGRLARTGLVTLNHGESTLLILKVELLTRNLHEHLMIGGEENLASLFHDVFAPAPVPTLTLDDFGHIEKPALLMRHYLARSLNTRRRGVNILLHGAPGTGKTQMARVIAQELGCALFEVSSADAEGHALNGEKRLRAYRFVQSFYTGRQALIAFDEAEDVFDNGNSLLGQKSLAQTHKAWINRALEDNAVPMLWLTNSIDCLDPAFVRRFDMVLEMPVPPRSQRRQIVLKTCGHLVNSDALARIAESEHLAPALITRAASVVESVADLLPKQQISEAIEYLVDRTLSAQGHARLTRKETGLPAESYDPLLLHTDADLLAIAAGLRRRSARLCLCGPSGTGKSAYGRWLADELGLPLHLKRASDLVSRYVGGTEENLARAFRAAEQDGALLLLDEVDSFLLDRRRASHSWEITAVNEMLTQMEDFSGVLVATTNCSEALDQASLRRFDLKIRFDYLRAEQAWLLLVRQCTTLGLSKPEDELRFKLAELQMLTPGDFSAVARQQCFRPSKTPSDLVSALESETLAKEGAKKTHLGFIRS